MKRVVIIEDDQLQSVQHKRLLTSAGFSVAVTSDAGEAMDMIDEDTLPSAVVADMLVSGSTIMPLLNEMQSHYDLAKIPIIVVSGIADRLSLADLRHYGVVALLDKGQMHPSDVVNEVVRVTT